MPWHHGGWVAGDWVTMGLVMTFFWGALVVLVVAFLRHPADRARRARSDAEAILGERFARGEIDRDEFQAKRDVLRGVPPTEPPKNADTEHP